MLVLTRKTGERIVIGDNISITIAEIKGDSIRLAIDAPKEIKIYRGEIYDAIVSENIKSAVTIGLDSIDILKEYTKEK